MNTVITPEKNSARFSDRTDATTRVQPSPETSSSRWQPSQLLQGVTEGLVDGILILTEQGELLYANTLAQKLCRSLVTSDSSSHSATVPAEIWRICEALLDSREIFPDQSLVLEDEIGDRKFPTLRVRVQWMDVGTEAPSYLLVVLEDRYQSLQNLAMVESHKYGLTARETEVWFRQQLNCSYKEIADELHITVNTVKKHIKSVRAKRQVSLCLEDDDE